MSSRNKSRFSSQNCVNEKGGKGQLAAACPESTVEERTSSGIPPGKPNLKEMPRGKIVSLDLSDHIDPSYRETDKKETNLFHTLLAKIRLCLDNGFACCECCLWSPGPVTFLCLELPLLLNSASDSLQHPREVWQSWFQGILYPWCQRTGRAGAGALQFRLNRGETLSSCYGKNTRKFPFIVAVKL